jgi:uncharacterized protein (TIRG00374 family)
LRKVVLAGLLAALVFAGLALYSDVRALVETAQQFAVSAFGLGLALAATNYGLRIARWQYYLKRIGAPIPLGESSIVFLSGFVMSVTPGKVGEVFKSLLLLESRGIPVARTAPIVVAERLTDLIALVGLVSLGALSFEHGLAITFSSALIVAFLLLVCAYRPLGHFVLELAERIPGLKRIGSRLREAYDALLHLTRPAPLLIGSFIGLLAWGLECGSLYVIVHGFAGAMMPWDAATFAYSASTLAGALAMMPGGLGVTEVGMTTLVQTLGGSSISAPVAAATTILVRIATLWFAVLVGACALVLHRRHHARRSVAPGDQTLAS